MQRGVSHYRARLLEHNLTPPESPTATGAVIVANLHVLSPTRLILILAWPSVWLRALGSCRRTGDHHKNVTGRTSRIHGLRLDPDLVGHVQWGTLGG